jgi:hypothetical protein
MSNKNEYVRTNPLPGQASTHERQKGGGNTVPVGELHGQKKAERIGADRRYVTNGRQAPEHRAADGNDGSNGNAVKE